MVYKRGTGNNYFYRFEWKGKEIKQSTKQSNFRVAEQMEAAHRTRLATGEVGIDDTAAPSLAAYLTRTFLPHIRANFAEKPKTRAYYEGGAAILARDHIGTLPLDRIDLQAITAFITRRRIEKYAVASINRQLEVLRRSFHLAGPEKLNVTRRALATVEMLPGESRRTRVITPEEEGRYLATAPADLAHYAAIIFDCGLRPEEALRLEWANITHDEMTVPYGKTASAFRTIPLTPRVQAIFKARQNAPNRGQWVFPAPTKSEHAEPSTFKKRHAAACAAANVAPFTFHTLRHTCITRWAPFMDPFTLKYLAGHKDMKTTERYVHPNTATVQAGMARAILANGAPGPKSGPSQNADSQPKTESDIKE